MLCSIRIDQLDRNEAVPHRLVAYARVQTGPPYVHTASHLLHTYIAGMYRRTHFGVFEL